MYTVLEYAQDLFQTGTVHLFLVFFAYVWAVWIIKMLLALRYRPFARTDREFTSTVILPVYNEPPEIFRTVLDRVKQNNPTELIVVVDGGDEELVAIAKHYTNKVCPIPKLGKRLAIAHGYYSARTDTDIILVLDSDTLWEHDMLPQLLAPFSDPRVGGVTPKQEIFGRDQNRVRRLAAWIEDIRYRMTVPMQSSFGQIGCLAGRTIAYRREPFEQALGPLVTQSFMGVSLHTGDDRVLTNEILKRGWKTVYQSNAVVLTDAPNTWRTFWKQQLRWGRSSQRETFLSLKWLWRKPVTFFTFVTDIITPFFLYAVVTFGLIRYLMGAETPLGIPLHWQIGLAYLGMVVSIGLRQINHFWDRPRDLLTLPLFVLQLTIVMAPTRIIAFATMFKQAWGTRTPLPEVPGAPVSS